MMEWLLLQQGSKMVTLLAGIASIAMPQHGGAVNSAGSTRA